MLLVQPTFQPSIRPTEQPSNRATEQPLSQPGHKSKSVKVLLIAATAASRGNLLLPRMSMAQPAPAEMQVNALEALFGKQAGCRRSQAKGICASGYFVGNAVGRSLSTAAVFNGDRMPVMAHFSVGGGNPRADDKSKSVRGLASQFSLPDGEQWLTANVSAPMYFVSKPDQFAPCLQVRAPEPDYQPDPGLARYPRGGARRPPGDRQGRSRSRRRLRQNHSQPADAAQGHQSICRPGVAGQAGAVWRVVGPALGRRGEVRAWPGAALDGFSSAERRQQGA